MTINQIVLRANAIFLMLIGSLQVIFELLSYFKGIGPLLDRFTGSAYTIGFFEAHGLAVMLGVLLWRAAAGQEKIFWHRFAVVIHLFLGAANLLFWDSFIQLNFVLPGIISTVFHGIFIVAEAYCSQKKD